MAAAAANPFDQFDAAPPASAGNAFDQFDAAPPPVRPPPQEQQSLGDRFANSPASFIGPAGVIETAAALGSNIVAQPLSGLAGIVQKGLNVAGIDNTSPADAVRQVQEGLIYQPRTYAGQAMTGAISKPFELLARGADTVASAYGGSVPATPNAAQQTPSTYQPGGAPWPYYCRPESPAIATVMNTAVQSAPAVLAPEARIRPGAAVRAAAPIAAARALAPREIAAQSARDAGFSLTPTQAGGRAGQLAEGLTGQAKLERQISLKNAPVVNAKAGAEIGLKDAKSITKGDLNRLKVEANKPYNELANTGVRKVSDEFRNELANVSKDAGGESFAAVRDPEVQQLVQGYSKIKQFTAQDAINQVRKLRKDGFANKFGKYDPEKNAKGDAQLKIADAIDNELERHADSLGKPELAAKYKAARVQLAKIATVENALRGSDVSALALARAQKNGAKLSGNLKTIADSATEFEKSFQEVRKIRDQGDLSVVDMLVGVGGSIASPAIPAAVLARPAIRKILASDAYQRRFIGRGKKATEGSQAPQPVNTRATGLATTQPDQKRASR